MLDLSQAAKLRNTPKHRLPPIRAELSGSDTCTALGITAHGHAPTLNLCRQLIAAGFDPGRPLIAHRGETPCIIVRSIGEGAALTVAEGSRGAPQFRSWKPMPWREGSSRIAPHRQGGLISIPVDAAAP